MVGLDHIKRQSKKVDVDRAWLDYYVGRSARKRLAGGVPRRRDRGDGYHYTKGWRRAS